MASSGYSESFKMTPGETLKKQYILNISCDTNYTKHTLSLTQIWGNIETFCVMMEDNESAIVYFRVLFSDLSFQNNYVVIAFVGIYNFT